jgi:hypothetical protein
VFVAPMPSLTVNARRTRSYVPCAITPCERATPITRDTIERSIVSRFVAPVRPVLRSKGIRNCPARTYHSSFTSHPM